MSFQNAVTVTGLLHSGVVMQVAIETKFSTPRQHALAVTLIIVLADAD